MSKRLAILKKQPLGSKQPLKGSVERLKSLLGASASTEKGESLLNKSRVNFIPAKRTVDDSPTKE